MIFLIGEGGWSYIERLSYRGMIGLFYENTWNGVLAYLIFGLFCIFAAIGFITVLKWLFFRKKNKKEDPGKKWLRTGKFN